MSPSTGSVGLTIGELVRIVTWRANIYSGNVRPRPSNWSVGGLIWDDLAAMPGRAALPWRHGGAASGLGGSEVCTARVLQFGSPTHDCVCCWWDGSKGVPCNIWDNY